MRLRIVLSAFFVLATSTFVILPANVQAAVASPSLKASILAKDPLKPSLQITNSSGIACQAVSSARGTIAITKVIQNGKELKAQPISVGEDESPDYLMRQQFKTLQPGDSLVIPLLASTGKSGSYLRSITWSSGDTFGSLYTLKAGQPAKLELNYSIPITPESGAPACGMVFASTIAAKSSGLVWKTVLTIAIIIAVALLAVFLLRKHRKKAAAVAIFAAFGLLGVMWQSPSAYAQVIVPDGMSADFDSCMAILENNRDITGPVLDVINDPSNRIEIVPFGGGSETSGIEHNYWIYWDTSDTHRYFGSGGRADPCDSLYHEMYHVYDMANGTFDMAECGASGISTKEVMATQAQNVLRERLGDPPRSHYGDHALPVDCSTRDGGIEHCEGEICGETNGDPHLRTFDGLRYDFQAVGEFVTSRDTSGKFEIQARQQPWADSRIVSLNTAVAMKVAGDKIEIRAGETAMELLVNGKKKTLEPTTFPGGGTLSFERGIAIVTWPDESKAWIRPVGSYGLHLAAEPSAALVGKLEGLLGNADGDKDNDLHARGSSKTIKAEFKELYPAFSDSWRITAKTSLFTYDKGKNTGSYSDKDFPDAHPPKLDTLPGYDTALAFCQSLRITDPYILDNCILDMAITGRPEFARAASNSQIVTAGASYSGTVYKLSVNNPGDSASATFDAAAGEKVYIGVAASSLPNQCGALHLVAPDGDEIANGCIINGGGNIDGTVLLVNGTYTINVTPGGPTGTVELRLVRISDKQGAITPEGAAVSLNIDKPGVVGRFTFSATSGQRVYVDIPKSTLNSQCGILRILGPDGSEIANGCIVNGKGNIDTAVLPATGQYTLEVNPTDDSTGTAQIKLILPTNETKTISLNGATLTAKLSKAGSTARFTFNGTAGQRVFIDLPSSELSSQCGILYVVQPDGATLGSGCVINNTGNLNDEGTVLPQTGQYTIVLDPSDNSTGTTTIKLHD